MIDSALLLVGVNSAQTGYTTLWVVVAERGRWLGTKDSFIEEIGISHFYYVEDALVFSADHQSERTFKSAAASRI